MAPPGHAQRSRLSVMTQNLCQVQWRFTIPGSVFTPSPKRGHRILQKLPAENVLFLHYLLPLLHRITEEEETNGMNAINLAICFAPTLLWPDSGLDVIKNEVPPLIQFMIVHSPGIFGPEPPDLYREDSFETPVDEEEEWGAVSLTPMGGAAGESPFHYPSLPILSSTDQSLLPQTASNQSITSRSSGSSGGGHYFSSAASNPKLSQSRPSNMSLVSSVSESSYASGSTVNKESPEPERPLLNREMVKYEITRRFHIPSRGNSFNSTGHGGTASRSDSFSQEMENIQRKFQERHRPEVLHSISTASSTTPHSEVEVLSSPQSFDDDRPESERHLHSLPRRSTETNFLRSPPPVQPVAVTTPQPSVVVYRRSRSSAAMERRRGAGGRRSGVEQNPSRLSVDNNNSDTESSPSRTLTRRERNGELNPRSLSASSRFQESVVRQRRSLGTAMLGTPGRSLNHPPLAEVSIIPAKKEEEESRSTLTSVKAALTQSLPPPPQVSSPQAAPQAGSDSKEDEVAPAIRPKSAEDGNSNGDDGDTEIRKRTMSNIEKEKVRLGLIPSRRRSKSISETKPGQPPVDRDVEEEEERAVSLSQGNVDPNERGSLNGEKADKVVDKRGMWRAHAPNSTDRKEAYALRMKAMGSMARAIAGQRGGSTKVGVSGPAPPPVIQRTATAPEMGAKRRATTMPEYLATRSSGVGRQGRVLGHGLVRTVKITSYSIPEPQKIHRINLRTFH